MDSEVYYTIYFKPKDFRAEDFKAEKFKAEDFRVEDFKQRIYIYAAKWNKYGWGGS